MDIITRLIPKGKSILIRWIDKSTGEMKYGTINRRPGIFMNWEEITVHNTGNPKSTAENEVAWLTNPDNQRAASFHIAIHEKTIVQAIPDNEVAGHAEDAWSKPGNATTLSIEVCESGDFEATIKTAAEFIAYKLHQKNKESDKVTTHHRWTGKYCPRLLLPRWKEFIEMIDKELEKLESIPEWKKSIIKEAHEKGNINDYDYWLVECNNPMPAWATLAIANNLKDQIESLKKRLE